MENKCYFECPFHYESQFLSVSQTFGSSNAIALGLGRAIAFEMKGLV
jgi:hypothetical protein